MNLTVPKESLAKLLYLTNTIVERKHTMPILANVKLSAFDNKLSVSATDLEISLIGETPAEVKIPGNVTVDAKVIYDIVRELPDLDVSIVVSKRQRLEIDCGQAHFRINGTASDEYPEIKGVSLVKPVEIDASMLCEMLEKTAFSVSTDESRTNITGVCAQTIDLKVGVGNNCLRLVATDGHRLSFVDRPAEGFNLNESVIIPRKGIQELKKVLELGSSLAAISIDNGFITVQTEGITIGVRLQEGQFPDYTKVIPASTRTTIKLDRANFLSAIKRVALVTTDKTKAVRLRLVDGSLLISSSSQEYGDASDSLTVEQEGEDVTIGFNSKYLIDLLTVMSECETIVVKFCGDLEPGVFKPENDDLYSCIVMPMRYETVASSTGGNE